MHWRNSNFQIKNFLEAHTPDERYRILCEHREDRIKALAMAAATSMKVDAEQSRLLWISKNAPYEHEREGALAQLTLMQAERIGEEECIEAAKQELAFIEGQIAAIIPHRKFAHLPDAEAFQACQEAEWEAKLIHRAQNMLESQGFIPWDHLQTMKQHPAWATSIHPAISMKVEEISLKRRQTLLVGGEAPRLLNVVNNHQPERT